MATMTGTDIKTAAGYQIPPNDISDATYLVYIGNALDMIRIMRPDAFLSDNGFRIAKTKPTALAQTLVLDDNWKMPISELVAYWCLMQDATDKEDKTRAQIHLKNAIGFLTGNI